MSDLEKRGTKIVILGSCNYEPYEVLAVPNKIPNAWNTEKGYKIAAEKFYPAIDQADFVVVYNPSGIGEHTQRDVNYAKSRGKRLVYVFDGVAEAEIQKLKKENAWFTKIVRQVAEKEGLVNLSTEEEKWLVEGSIIEVMKSYRLWIADFIQRLREVLEK